MRNKYTYFVSYTFQTDRYRTISSSDTIEIYFKVKCAKSVSKLIDSIKCTFEISNVSLVNFNLLSEQHEPEKSENVEEFLKEFSELFTRYDAQIEIDSTTGELSVMVGDKEAIVVRNGIIDSCDINAKIAEH